MIADFGDHTSVYISIDNGIDQTLLWNNPLFNAMEDLYESGKMFRLPTTEVQDQIRFKLLETASDLYLYTGEKKQLPVRKTGCPFAVLA